MGSSYLLIFLLLFLGAGLAIWGVYVRRAWWQQRRARQAPTPLEVAIRKHHLDPSQAATLAALAARGSPASAPPFASEESFDRGAVIRLREVLRRGEDVRAEAERLRLLRRALGYVESTGPPPRLLSSVFLVSPMGEKCDGIVLGVDGDYLVVAARGMTSSLHAGARLSVMDVVDEKVGDTGGTVVHVETHGDCRVVRIGFPRDDEQARRRHFRLVARLEAQAQVGAEAPFEAATVVDVSRTGVRLQMRPSVAPKQEDPVVLQVKVGDEVVETRGRVIWARQALYLASGAQPWLVGAEFPEFKIEDWARIVERIVSATVAESAKGGVRTVTPEAIP